MNEPFTMDKLVSIGQESLTQVVREGEDFLPKLLVGYSYGAVILYGLAIDMDELPTILPTIMTDKIDWISLTTDSYYAALVTGDDGPVSGRLGEAFDAGDTRVSEALSICLVTEHAADFMMVPYRRTGPQQRTVSWREPITQTGLDVGGPVQDMLRFAVEMSGQPQPEDES